MKTKYKLLKGPDGSVALIRERRGFLKTKVDYYYMSINTWGPGSNWYASNRLDDLNKAFNFFCVYGEVEVLQSSGDIK